MTISRLTGRVIAESPGLEKTSFMRERMGLLLERQGRVKSIEKIMRLQWGVMS